MRLTLVIQSNSCGGAERVMSIMANYWADRGWQITLLTLDDGSLTPFYELNWNIKQVPLGVAGDSGTTASAVRNNVERISVLRRAILASQPEAVISFMSITNVITLLATLGSKIPIIVAEHSNPKVAPISGVWRRLRQLTYRCADRVVILNEDALDYFTQTMSVSACVIPNPVVSRRTNQISVNENGTSHTVVAMGRLVPVKGFDLLLKAFAKLKDRHPDWILTILGEGPLRSELESLRDGLGLKNRVSLPGTTKDPDFILRQSDLFVLSSRVEGFPMALCEAMANGLPVICTEYSSALREIVRNEIDGLLVPSEDVKALSAAMDRLMGDSLTRQRLGLNALEVTERFSPTTVMGLWEELLIDCTLRRGIRPAESRLACNESPVPYSHT